VIKNPISGPLEELALLKFLERFDESVHTQILERFNRKDVDGAVLFENIQLDSSNLGKRTACIYGPGCTYETLEKISQGWLNDLPSQRQYPVAYVRKADLTQAIRDAVIATGGVP
jgi:hypothetical protein